MAGTNLSVDIIGAQIQGIAGASHVEIHNFTIINRQAEEPNAPAAVAEAIGPCPYPGLAYFGPDDAALFFGRDAAVTRLADGIGRDSFTALVGASGSGKSSVVLAGLAPLLHGKDNWRFSYFRIGTERDPFIPLARALVPLYVTGADDTERLTNTRKLAARLKSGELSLHDVFADCRSRNKGTKILLIADQFEECFTQIESEAVVHRFIDTLLAGFPPPSAGSSPDICLILTLRADFYGRALLYRPLADALQGHVENLGPMNQHELRAAILQPAEALNISFEPGLVETLLDDVEGKPAALPLLQFALREMWAQQELGRITRRSYDAVGGVEGALARRAEAIFSTQTADGSDATMASAFQRLFTRMVTPGEGEQDTRRVVLREELQPDLWSLAQRLAGEDNRLVVTNALPSSHETAEVMHEALIRHWPRLAGWVNADRTFLSWLRQVRPTLDVWTANPADEGPLLRGGMLAQATDWLANRGNDLSPNERHYVVASIALRQRAEAEKEAAQQAELQRERALAESRRRQRLAAIAASLLLLVIAAAALWERGRAVNAESVAVAQRQLAREQRDVAQGLTLVARSRQLAAEALNHLDDAFDLSLLLSLEAVNTADTFEARNALFSGMLHYPRIDRYLHGQLEQAAMGARSVQSYGIAISRDGSMLAAIPNHGGPVTLYDQRTGGVMRVLSAGDDHSVESMAFSRDGAVLAAGDDNKQLSIWDPVSAKRVARATNLPDSVDAVAFGSDRQTVYSGAGDKLYRWNWTSAGPLRAFSLPDLRLVDHVHITVGDRYAVVSGSSQNGNDVVTEWIDLVADRRFGSVQPGDAIAINAAGNLVAVAQEGRVQLFDANTATPVGQPMTGDFGQSAFAAAAFAPRGDVIAIAANDRISLWDVKTGATIGQPWSGHVENIDALVFDPDGRHLTSLAEDNSVIYWNVIGPRDLFRQFAASKGSWALAFSPRDGILASTGEATTTIWDSRTGKASAVFETPDLPEAVPAFSADGQMLLLSDSRERDEKDTKPSPAAVFELSTNQRVLSLPDGMRGGPVAMSPDDRYVALVDGLKRVVLQDRATHTVSAPVAVVSDTIAAMTFVAPDQIAVGDVQGKISVCQIGSSPTPCTPIEGATEARSLIAIPGQNLLLSTGTQTVYLSSLSSHRLLRRFAYPSFIGAPAVAAVDAKAQLVAWGDYSRNAIQLMDIRLSGTFGEQLHAPGEGDKLDGPTGLAFSADGRVLASVSQGVIDFWDFDLASWRRRACTIANRNLTEEEWDRYGAPAPYHKTCEGLH
jgi:WD40 repeat protein